jgi:hypothetical protein
MKHADACKHTGMTSLTWAHLMQRMIKTHSNTDEIIKAVIPSLTSNFGLYLKRKTTER